MRGRAAPALCLLLGLAAARPGFAARTMVRLSSAPGGHFFLEFDAHAKVLFFPQEHDAEDLGLVDRQAVLRSQFALATFLNENRQYAVFMEGSVDYAPADWEAFAGKEFQANFTDSAFPPTLDGLTRRQGSTLMRLGGPLIHYGLKILPEIHAAIAPEEARRLDVAIEAHMRRTGQTFETLDATGMGIVLGQREAAAARHVKAFLAAHPDRQALVVFGAAHEFSPHFAGLAYGRVETAAPAPAEESKEVAHGAEADAPSPLSAGSVDALQPNHRTRLMNAVTARDAHRAEALLAQHHADIRIRDRMGYNALILAALDNNPGMLKLLLRHLAPADVHMPVTLVEGDLVKTHEDLIALLEEKNLERGADFFEVIQLLKAFAKASAPAKQGPTTPPGFLGDLSRFLPPWL